MRPTKLLVTMKFRNFAGLEKVQIWIQDSPISIQSNRVPGVHHHDQASDSSQFILEVPNRLEKRDSVTVVGLCAAMCYVHCRASLNVYRSLKFRQPRASMETDPQRRTSTAILVHRPLSPVVRAFSRS